MLVITLAVAAADWATKAAVAALVPLGAHIELLSGRVAIWHVRNPEMILGLWGNLTAGTRQVMAWVAVSVAVLLAYELVGRGHRLSHRRRPWVWYFGGLAFGGMLGNLGERLLHWGVTDFLSFYWGGEWLPPGNVADIALFLCIPLALPVIYFELEARSWRGRRRRRLAGEDAEARSSLAA
jgi:lipoprotein signal peptidase